MAKKKKKKTDASGRKNAKGASAQHLPAAELDVMACLWKEGESTARGIREAMSRYRPMAHGSVVTLLSRLEDKGMVNKKKAAFGKAFIFMPGKSPESTYRSLTGEMVRRVFAGDSAKMVESMFSAHAPTKDECDAIAKLAGAAKRKAKIKTRRR